MREARWKWRRSRLAERLDRYLASVLPGHSRSQVQRLIEQGHVRVEGRQARANLAVKAGDRIAVVIPRLPPQRPKRRISRSRFSTRTPDLIVIDKPAGMVVHPAAGHASGTLVNALLHHVQDLSGVGGELRPGIVHRLDEGHVRRDGRRQARQGATRSWRGSSRSARSRRNASRSSGVSCRRAGGSTCRSDATRTTGRRCRRAPAARDRR